MDAHSSPGLSYFLWITWIAPNNVVVNQLFGGPSGFGLFPLTFDWTIVSGYLTSPLIFPWHAIANMVGGIVIFFTIVAAGLKYSGVWFAEYLPVINSHAYDNTGNQYNVSMILDEQTRFDLDKYNAYSPLFLPTQFALAYGLSFAAVAAVIVHVVLYHGKEIWQQFKLARHQEDDVHMKMMKKYRDAPDWWYGVLFLIMIGISLAVVCAWPTDFPWWAYLVCIIIAMVWTLPVGIVQAITNLQIGLNVLTELYVP
jgi:OPT family oligopeptide transporter